MHPGDGRVVSNFVVQALTNKSITIYGDGSNTRSFCYVYDLIDALTRLMDSTDSDFTGPVNLGNPNEMTILAPANLVIDLTGAASVMQFQQAPEDDPSRRKPDISLAKGVLNWIPRTSLVEGTPGPLNTSKYALKNPHFPRNRRQISGRSCYRKWDKRSEKPPAAPSYLS